MRAAEQAAIDRGTPVDKLMERAGAAVAEAAWRFAGHCSTLILCGPGNNGGDGYVAARLLGARGCPVTVAASDDPRTEIACAARAAWHGPVLPLEQATPQSLLIDCLYGTGLKRGLANDEAAALASLAGRADWRMAVDLPSGVATDDGALLSSMPRYDLTVALGALKPAHLLQPAAGLCGRLVLADIGLGPIASDLHEVPRPRLSPPSADDHKYRRGLVAIVGGAMPGAAMLAAGAAQRLAGYVMLSGASARGALSLVHRDAIGDPRIGALLIGPGLGRDEAASDRLEAALRSGHRLVIDADALTILGKPERLRAQAEMPILTPHEGEFATLFGPLPGSKVDRARAAAVRANAVIVLKGADSVVAHPDGRAAIVAQAPGWLASAGTGDVLAGIIAGLVTRRDPFEAASAGLWLHGEAARRAGPALIADDLIVHLPAAIGACL